MVGSLNIFKRPHIRFGAYKVQVNNSLSRYSQFVNIVPIIFMSESY
jgi:hypothetical protein